jgi:branched-subunit amino acid ABC-type transport system permease component
MSDYVPYLIFGITAGSIYGISAMGLVLTYKTSGVFNFAHGATSAVSAYVFYELRQVHGWSWPLAGVVAALVFGPLSGLLLERLAVSLARVSVTNRIVATIGLLVAIQAGTGVIYGPASTFTFHPFLPQAEAFKLAGVAVSYDNIFDLLFGIALAVALFVLFTRTRIGLQMRAVVDDPDLLDMVGTSPARVRRFAWVIGSILASISGILFAAAQQQLDISVLTLLVVQAFGAAAIARFTSLPLAFVGGLVVGIAQKLIAKQIAGHDSLQGLDLNVPFIVLFAFLLFTSRSKLIEVGRQIKERPLPASPFSGRQRRRGYALLVAVAVVVPYLGFVGTHLTAWSQAVGQMVLFLSLGLLVRTSGQISLCHIAFAAVGACAFAHGLSSGLPWGLAVAVGGLAVVPLAAFISIPAIRLSGLFLGLATLGFGIFIAQYAYPKSYMFGGGLLKTPRPHVWGLQSDRPFYYLLLSVTVLTIGLIFLIERSRLGRLLRGLADSPTALTTVGVSINATRVLVFCISGFLAGVSGGTTSSLFGTVSIDSFNYVQSLLVLAVLAISGKRTVTSAVVACLLLYVVPDYISSARAVYYLQFSFGVLAIISATGAWGRLAQRLGRGATGSHEPLTGTTSDRVEEAAAHEHSWLSAPDLAWASTSSEGGLRRSRFAARQEPALKAGRS